jgi:hypothetical protein
MQTKIKKAAIAYIFDLIDIKLQPLRITYISNNQSKKATVDKQGATRRAAGLEPDLGLGLGIGPGVSRA